MSGKTDRVASDEFASKLLFVLPSYRFIASAADDMKLLKPFIVNIYYTKLTFE